MSESLIIHGQIMVVGGGEKSTLLGMKRSGCSVGCIMLGFSYLSANKHWTIKSFLTVYKIFENSSYLSLSPATL